MLPFRTWTAPVKLFTGSYYAILGFCGSVCYAISDQKITTATAYEITPLDKIVRSNDLIRSGLRPLGISATGDLMFVQAGVEIYRIHNGIKSPTGIVDYRNGESFIFSGSQRIGLLDTKIKSYKNGRLNVEAPIEPGLSRIGVSSFTGEISELLKNDDSSYRLARWNMQAGKIKKTETFLRGEVPDFISRSDHLEYLSSTAIVTISDTERTNKTPPGKIKRGIYLIDCKSGKCECIYSYFEDFIVGGDLPNYRGNICIAHNSHEILFLIGKDIYSIKSSNKAIGLGSRIAKSRKMLPL